MNNPLLEILIVALCTRVSILSMVPKGIVSLTFTFSHLRPHNLSDLE